jgi:preprotein translocase subunit YajC
MSFFISDAMASGAPAQQGGGLELLIMVGIFFAIMYFMIIRPQAKRAKEHRTMLDALGKGDEVSTTGGIVGKVVNIGENMVELKIAENTNIKVQKHAVASLMPKGTMKEL